jgi:hypothetical protein
MPRQAIFSELPAEEEGVDICQFKTQDIEINVYDTNLNKVDAKLSYICFSQRCELGETTDGRFIGKAPACVNGYLRTLAEGYAEKKQLLSTNEESSADVILDREYETNVELDVGGKPLDGMAVVSFVGERSASTALPEPSKIKLSEGLYNVSVYVYGNSSITIPATTKRECQTITRSGIAGLFGATEEKCFDFVIPETKIENALIGGGRGEIYLMPSDLEKGKIKLKVDSLPKPASLDELAGNYEAFDEMKVEMVI